MKIDLHCHSTFSDGSCTPLELIQRAESLSIDALSITDHDTLRAYETPLVGPVKILPGIELSSYLRETNVHILAYAFLATSPVLVEFCKTMRDRRFKRAYEIADLLKKQGVDLPDIASIFELNNTKPINRVDFGRALVKGGFVKTIQEAFKLYLGDGRSCYVDMDKFSIGEILEVVHAAQGFAVWAHPHLIEPKSLIPEILKFPFDGLECYYGFAPKKENERWARIAEEKKILATGGSDFHGDARPSVELGASLTPEPVFRFLWEHYLRLEKPHENSN